MFLCILYPKKAPFVCIKFAQKIEIILDNMYVVYWRELSYNVIAVESRQQKHS